MSLGNINQPSYSNKDSFLLFNAARNEDSVINPFKDEADQSFAHEQLNFFYYQQLKQNTQRREYFIALNNKIEPIRIKLMHIISNGDLSDPDTIQRVKDLWAIINDHNEMHSSSLIDEATRKVSYGEVNIPQTCKPEKKNSTSETKLTIDDVD